MNIGRVRRANHVNFGARKYYPFILERRRKTHSKIRAQAATCYAHRIHRWPHSIKAHHWLTVFNEIKYETGTLHSLRAFDGPFVRETPFKQRRTKSANTTQNANKY